jgi:hypothetical protein
MRRRALKPTFGRFPPSTSVRSRRLTLAKDAAWATVSRAPFRRDRIVAPSWREVLMVWFMGMCYVKGLLAFVNADYTLYVTVINYSVNVSCTVCGHDQQQFVKN